MNGSLTVPVAFDVVIDGSLLSGHAVREVTAAMVRRFGLSEEAAAELLCGGREVVKRGLDQAKSETYVAALRRCGVDARAERVESATRPRGGGDASSLAVDYAAAYVPAVPPPRRPGPAVPLVVPAHRGEPAPRGGSLTVVGWSYIVAVPLTLVLFAFGDALGRGAMFLLLCAFAGAAFCHFWLLSIIWQHRGAFWAIVAFFFWPVSLVFTFRHWYVARQPFLTSLAVSLVYFAALPSLDDLGAVECGSPGSFSYDDGEGCVCEDEYDWCGAEDNDMSCCRM